MRRRERHRRGDLQRGEPTILPGRKAVVVTRETEWLVVRTLRWDGTGSLVELLTEWLARQPTSDAILFDEIQSPTGRLDVVAVLGGIHSSEIMARLGTVLHLGDGRTTSVAVRELTALDHLLSQGTCLLICDDEEGERLNSAGEVAKALQLGTPATAGSGDEYVMDAPNLPPPRTPGGFPIELAVQRALGSRSPLTLVTESSPNSAATVRLRELDLVDLSAVESTV